MLSEQEIKKALRADRVLPISVPNLHGPLGWAHLARELARFLGGNGSGAKLVKPLEMPAETWQKLQKLADEATRAEARPVTATEVAAAILQHYVGAQQ